MSLNIGNYCRWIWIGCAFIMTSCHTTNSGSQNLDNSSTTENSVSRFNDSCMAAGLWTGAVVLAGTADSITFHGAWGYTSVEKTVELTKDAIFDMASLTKPVATAMAIAICMDRGLVDTAVPFIQYLPEFTGRLKGTVTILDLARHISGFDNSKLYLNGGPMIKNLLSNSPVWPPKQKYEYACINYILLGLIVEKVTGKSISEFCKENIFDPLSMQDTKWSPLQKPDRIVKSVYTPELGTASDHPARAAGRPIGNAGLFSTAGDLAKFCQMMLTDGKHNGYQMLSENALRAMRTKADTCSPVTLGWFIDPIANPSSLSEATLSHTGWVGNSIWIDPVRQCYVIVLTNRTGDHDLAINARIELAELALGDIHKGLFNDNDN